VIPRPRFVALLLGVVAAFTAVSSGAAANCNLFGPTEPCDPYLLYPPGQDLRLTIEGRAGGRTPERERGRELKTVRDVFTALRACWRPPDGHDARPGVSVSVRVSFNRDGNMIGQPRFTFVTARAPEQIKQAYRSAAHEALRRCTPLPLSPALGGAIAGRPFMIPYIDLRSPQPGMHI